MSVPGPGWYPDPFHRYDLRYFNGSAWTADVSAAGHRVVDPLGTSPTPLAAGFGPPGTVAGAGPGPGYGPPTRSNGFGVAALVLGIVAVVTAWVPFLFVVGAICGVLAIVFALLARRRRATHGPSQAATVGLVLGPISVLLAVGGFALTRLVLDVVRPGPYSIGATECVRDDARQVFSGSIHNESGRTRSYSIDVSFLRAGTGNVLDTATVDVKEVPSGDEAPWSVSVQWPGTDVDCRVDTVTGWFEWLQ